MVVLFSCGSFVWFFYFHTIPSHHSFISRWFFCMINLFLHLILSHDSYISTSDSFHVNLWFSHDSFTQFFYFHMILSHGLFFTCDSFVRFFYFHVIFFPHNFFFLISICNVFAWFIYFHMCFRPCTIHLFSTFDFHTWLIYLQLHYCECCCYRKRINLLSKEIL